MICQQQTSWSKSKIEAHSLHDDWRGGVGLLSRLGQLVFNLSGAIYSRNLIRAARLTPAESVIEIGCGMGAVLTETQRVLHSTASYVGVDLSLQRIAQGRSRAENHRDSRTLLLVGSGVDLPIKNSQFDVVLLSHVAKYLTDEQLSQTLWEARRILKPGGRIVLWDFHPFWVAPIRWLLLRDSKARKLREPGELQKAMRLAGFRDLNPFRIEDPWLRWADVALIGRAA